MNLFYRQIIKITGLTLLLTFLSSCGKSSSFITREESKELISSYSLDSRSISALNDYGFSSHGTINILVQNTTIFDVDFDKNNGFLHYKMSNSEDNKEISLFIQDEKYYVTNTSDLVNKYSIISSKDVFDEVVSSLCVRFKRFDLFPKDYQEVSSLLDSTEYQIASYVDSSSNFSIDVIYRGYIVLNESGNFLYSPEEDRYFKYKDTLLLNFKKVKNQEQEDEISYSYFKTFKNPDFSSYSYVSNYEELL